MGDPTPTPRLVAFLRGMNLGNRRITNDELADIFEEAGLDGVAVYQASGNVIFDDPGRDLETLEAELEQHLEASLGYGVDVFVRRLDDLAEIATFAEPHAGEADDFKLHVLFLRDEPDPPAGHLDALAGPDDRFLARRSEIYWLRRGGLANTSISPFGPDGVTRGETGTMRTLGTVQRILKKFGPAAFIALVLGACGGGTVPLPELPPHSIGDTVGLVERGEYIVRDVAVCGHCHARDPQRDPDGPLSGGYEFSNWRLGTVRAANLTPDSATGLGEWSDAAIVRSIRTGEDADGEVLAPVMPYHWFHGMSDRDALAVTRYLRSLPPVTNPVENDPNLVYEAAELLFLEPEDPPGPVLAPPRAPTAEYGGYLARHVGLCADCHTPRTGLRATPDRDRLFAGQADPPGGFPARPSNLTPDTSTGIGAWSEAEFLRTLRTGVDPAGDSLHPFMPWRQIRRMTDDDLRAIYRFLRTLPPTHHEVPEGPVR